jgi:hypothetical protein
MDFAYSAMPASPDGAFPDRTVIKRPLLRLTLRYNDRSFSTWAIVDSGADFCLFPASIAVQLGVAIPNPKATPFSGTADAPQIAYFETVQATIGNGEPDGTPLTFDLYAGFCETLEHVGLGLLGQESFFSRFIVSFDHSQNLIRIE